MELLHLEHQAEAGTRLAEMERQRLEHLRQQVETMALPLEQVLAQLRREVDEVAQGTLEVLDYAHLSSFDGYLGYEPTGAGDVTLSGYGSQWAVADDLIVGHKGSGSLTVSNAGHLSCANGFFAMYAGSDAAVTFEGDWTGVGAAFLYIGGNKAGPGGVCWAWQRKCWSTWDACGPWHGPSVPTSCFK